MMFNIQWKCIFVIIFYINLITYGYSLFPIAKYHHQSSLFSTILQSNQRLDDSQLSYIKSLESGQFVKLICGASNQDSPLIRNLCFLYTIAQVDCIDLCADPAIVAAANNGVMDAMMYFNITRKPIIMISVNDDDDPHFRKASFDISVCPADCSRPCEKICPAAAIPSLKDSVILEGSQREGVIQDKCYGCGRCIYVCPINNIVANSYQISASTINELLNSGIVNAIEIHTQKDHEDMFRDLWSKVSTSIFNKASILAVSFPDLQEETVSYMERLQAIISKGNLDIDWNDKFKGIQIWQADGRPMSGDIGNGTTYSTCKLADKVLNHYNSYDRIDALMIDFASKKHFIQLAGGANSYSSTLSDAMGLNRRVGFGGEFLMNFINSYFTITRF